MLSQPLLQEIRALSYGKLPLILKYPIPQNLDFNSYTVNSVVNGARKTGKDHEDSLDVLNEYHICLDQFWSHENRWIVDQGIPIPQSIHCIH